MSAAMGGMQTFPNPRAPFFSKEHPENTTALGIPTAISLPICNPGAACHRDR